MYIIQSLNFLALIRFCNKRSIGCLLLYCNNHAGKGRFGQVYECFNLDSGEINAVKQVS